MRPQGDIRLLASAALIDGGGTTRQIAERIGAGRHATHVAICNMRKAGDVEVTRTVRVPGVKRPVPFYERAQATSSAGDEPAHEPLLSLIALWATPAGPCSSISDEEGEM